MKRTTHVPARALRMAMSAALAALVALVATPARAIDDQTVPVHAQDPEMQAAIAAARAGLDDFLAKQAAPPAGASQFRLKVMFRAGSRVEHMWVMPFRRLGDGFAGILADEPASATSLRLGQRVDFAAADISDWAYVQDGHQRGSFTVCVLFKRMPAEVVRQYREQYGFDC